MSKVKNFENVARFACSNVLNLSPEKIWTWLRFLARRQDISRWPDVLLLPPFFHRFFGAIPGLAPMKSWFAISGLGKLWRLQKDVLWPGSEAAV